MAELGARDRFCPSCGTEVDEDARFCPTCGQTLHDADELTGTVEAERVAGSEPVEPEEPEDAAQPEEAETAAIPAAPAWPPPEADGEPSPRPEPEPEPEPEPVEVPMPEPEPEPSQKPPPVATQPGPTAPPGPAGTAGPPPPSGGDDLPFTLPVTLSGWLIGAGSGFAALALLPGLGNLLNVLLFIALLAITASVFLADRMPTIAHQRLGILVALMIGLGIALERAAFRVSGVDTIFLMAMLVAAGGALLIELGRDRPVSPPGGLG